MRNIFSVDVEDYFQVAAFKEQIRFADWDSLESRVEANTDAMMDLFAEADVKGTFFVLGWIAERYPKLVERIHQAGHEVASHGYAHQQIYDQTPAQFRDDVHRSKGILEDIIGEAVVGYRAPTFSIVERSLWALDILIELGFQYDSSIFPIRHDRYGIPSASPYPHYLETKRGSILELPPLTLRFRRMRFPAAGGGYLRLLPMQPIQWAIRRHNEEGHPAMLYVHPWEIDPDQPRIPSSRITTVRHYRGLEKVADRLRVLLPKCGCRGKDLLSSDAPPPSKRSIEQPVEC